MPRYFVDTADGEFAFVDSEGFEAPDHQAARRFALAALPDMANDSIPNGDRQRFVVRVRNDKGELVYSATLTLTGEWAHDATDPVSDDFKDCDPPSSPAPPDRGGDTTR
jgi:hypothetical protein